MKVSDSENKILNSDCKSETQPTQNEERFENDSKQSISNCLSNQSNQINSSTIQNFKQNTHINTDKNIFPYCIVWTKLPLISSLFPSIGHTGICNSKGIIYDFMGSNAINEDSLGFGNPYKYVQLEVCPNWDKAVTKANEKFIDEEHNLFTNNCHSHVAYALNQMKYKGRSNYTMIDVWLMCSLKSRYISYYHVVKNYYLWIFLFLYMVYFLFRR